MTDQVVCGIHAVAALLNNQHRVIQLLWVNQERQDPRILELLAIAENRNIPIENFSSQKMKQRFGDLLHQGIVAKAKALPEYKEQDIPYLISCCKKEPLVLILDGITDPHNLGACLRTADAAGVDFIIIPKDKNVSLTSTVSKVASGAAEFIPLVKVTNLVRAIEILKEEKLWIYGAAGEAEDTLYKIDCQTPIAFVMGSEGSGLRRLTREHCDGLFALPMLGNVESLNVSVATGIVLYEAVRQRK